ncbi:phosphotransferase family protein [Vagococcus sp. JNUCC 83]
MFNFDKNWNLQPIKGDTGKAYKGMKENERVFIKRNSTPFLAALSREGLTPRLLWTKRTSNGDILTAQEWLDGRQLEIEEMSHNEDVAHMLRYLHQSESLKSMLKRMDGAEKTAFDFLKDYVTDLPQDLKDDDYLMRVFRYLENHLPSYNSHGFVACHGDAIHNNWMLASNGELYLVDWDYSVLSDPAYDLGTILGQYVDKNDWSYWLSLYGVKADEELIERIYWYVGMNLLQQIRRSYIRKEMTQVSNYMLTLKKIYDI